MAAPKTQPRLRAVTSRGEERRARKTLQGESSLGGPSPLGGLCKLLSPACGLVLSVLHTLVFVGVSGALDICPVFSTVSSSGPVIALSGTSFLLSTTSSLPTKSSPQRTITEGLEAEWEYRCDDVLQFLVRQAA